MESTLNAVQDFLLDGGYLPLSVIRLGIRRLLAQRVSMIASASLTAAYETKMKYVESLRRRPIAIETDKANEQHYEVGTGVLKCCLGPRMKYSCCWYNTGAETLGQAEVDMLNMYVERAEVKDGMTILDLGCGWGSLSIYLAQRFPNSKIVAISNSKTQKAHIDGLAKVNVPSLKNLTCITGDVTAYEFDPEAFDRVLSIELFEHMKNYERLLAKVAHTLKPEGKLFVHLFTHKESPYDFDGGWMTEHFFTGGTMPSADLLLYFQRDLFVQRQWWVNGKHYAKTCEDWLAKMTRSRREILPHLRETYGEEKGEMWFYRWQIFYMACAELFAWEGGDTWGVAHYLFEKPTARKG